MLKLIIPAREIYDEEKNEFLYTKEHVISLEHSLVSVAKWESKWGKPFLGRNDKTVAEALDYIKCMTITQNVDDSVYLAIDNNAMQKINDYIEAPMTATWFAPDKSPPSREIVTSELIYYWMIELGIPFECQKWHLNRLFTLIKVCSIKKNPPKKMSKKEILMRNKELNDARRKARNTKG